MYEYCLENKIEVSIEETLKFQKKSRLSYLNSLFHALSWIFRFYINTINIKRLRGTLFSNHDAKITIFTFFRRGGENKYWLGLNKYLKSNNIKSNWIHLSSINDNSIESKKLTKSSKMILLIQIKMRNIYF